MEQNKKKAVLYSIFLLGLILVFFEIYAGSKGVETSGRVEEIWVFSYVPLSVYWIINDARVRKVGSPFTNGFIMYILWPFMAPLYFLKVNGKKGALLVLGLFIVCLLPEITSAVLYYFA